MAIESMYVFTGDEVIAMDLPAKLNENFAKTENGMTNLENRVIPIEKGGTGATSVAGARNALGLGNTTGALPIANGGTGATSVAEARNNLGLGNTNGALPIANGGTGATTASDACKNLGAVQTVNGKEPDAGGNVNIEEYTHPTTSGNKHIPSGGSSGQILRWSADGTATWGANNYRLPTASSSTLGGVKVGSGLTISNGILSASGGGTAYKIPYGICTTAGNAKVATISNGVSFSLTEGTVIAINFADTMTNSESGTITLNVNSTGAKPLRIFYNSDSWAYWGSPFTKYEGVALLIYDGTAWHLDSPLLM